MKRQAIDWENILVTHSFTKGLVFIIYIKNFYNSVIASQLKNKMVKFSNMYFTEVLVSMV